MTQRPSINRSGCGAATDNDTGRVLHTTQGRIQRTGLGWLIFWPREPNLPPFSTFSTDLGHLILKLLNFDVYVSFFLFIFIFI